MRRAVLFDLFNTLVPGGDDGARDGILDEMADLLEVEPAAYQKAFADTSPERFTGAMGDLSSVVRTVAQRAGGEPSDEQVEAATALRRGLTAGLLAVASDETLSVLDELRAAGWPLGVVSNTTSESPDRFRESRLADRFDAAVFSSELGIRKPDPGIYLAACEALGVAPESCTFVGDGADRELAAAATLGMRAVRTTEFADTDPGWDGPVIRALTDLPSMVA